MNKSQVLMTGIVGFLALTCEIFTHMDWARFIELSKKQQRRDKAYDEIDDDVEDI